MAEESLRHLVRKAVREQLGREPIDRAEEVRIRRAIYDAHPGLSEACRREEARERLRRV